MGLTRLGPRIMGRTVFLSGGSGKGPLSLPLPASRGHPHSLSLSPFLPFQSQYHQAESFSHCQLSIDLFCPTLPLLGNLAILCWAHLDQDSLPIWWSATFILLIHVTYSQTPRIRAWPWFCLPYPLSCNWLPCIFHIELCLLESCRPENIAVRQFCNSLFISPFVSPFFSPFLPTKLFRHHLLPRVQVLPFLNNLTPPWFQNSLPSSPDSDSSSAVISSRTSDYSMDSSHFFESHCSHL